MDLLLINIMFADGKAPDGGYYMTAIPRVGEHIRVALGPDPAKERVVKVTEVEYFASMNERDFSAYGKIQALITVGSVEG